MFRVIFTGLGLLVSGVLHAQCSLCTATVKNGAASHTHVAGLGLNNGILVLLILPYIIVAIVALLWYINARKGQKQTSRSLHIGQ